MQLQLLFGVWWLATCHPLAASGRLLSSIFTIQSGHLSIPTCLVLLRTLNFRCMIVYTWFLIVLLVAKIKSWYDLRFVCECVFFGTHETRDVTHHVKVGLVIVVLMLRQASRPSFKNVNLWFSFTKFALAYFWTSRGSAPWSVGFPWSVPPQLQSRSVVSTVP